MFHWNHKNCQQLVHITLILLHFGQHYHQLNPSSLSGCHKNLPHTEHALHYYLQHFHCLPLSGYKYSLHPNYPYHNPVLVWVSVYLLPFGLRYSGFMFWSLSPDYMVWPSLDDMDHICKVTNVRRNKPTLATNPLTMTEAHLSSKFNFSSTLIIRLILTLTRYITTVVWDRALPFVLALHCGNCSLI